MHLEILPPKRAFDTTYVTVREVETKRFVKCFHGEDEKVVVEKVKDFVFRINNEDQ